MSRAYTMFGVMGATLLTVVPFVVGIFFLLMEPSSPDLWNAVVSSPEMATASPADVARMRTLLGVWFGLLAFMSGALAVFLFYRWRSGNIFIGPQLFFAALFSWISLGILWAL